MIFLKGSVNMKKFFSILLSSILFTALLTPLKSYSSENLISLNKSMVNLQMDQRKLWIDHVLWTRNFIVSDLASLPDKEDVLQRLLKNQDDIGSSIKPYYGEEAGNKLSVLLREHIAIAGQVVDAASSNNKDALDKYSKSLYKNADEIAEFLSSANPNWSNSKLKDMLYKHLELVINQAVSRLNKDWKADIDTYDKGEDHIIMFADMLSEGIIKQFPDKFK